MGVFRESGAEGASLLTKTGEAAGLSGWRRHWHNLSFCWGDPDAAADVQAAFRERQHRAFLQQMPVDIFDCIACALIEVALFWNDADHGLLLAWCGVLLVLAGINFFIWRQARGQADSQRIARAARTLLWTNTIVGILFAWMLVYLFGKTDVTGKILLTAFFATNIPHGAFHNARWPWAGGLWTLGMSVTGVAGLLYYYGYSYAYLAALVALYGISVFASVLISSRLFIQRLMAEFEIDRQKQLIGLLLDDFEDSASDWLWETDAPGRLTHVSKRLVDASGLSLAALLGQPISTIFSVDGDESGREAEHELRDALRLGLPFREIKLPIKRGGQRSWWSLSGKPVRDANERIAGWRGVGTDVTAEYLRQRAERDLQESREAAARLAGELDSARRIQMGLLPPLGVSFAAETRFSVAAILEPAREVGGDYYECFRLDERRICFAVADVSGKGVPASLFMAMTKSLASSIARRSRDLGDAVREISDELDLNNPEMLFVTAFIAVLDLNSGELDFVSAGHDAPFLLRGGRIERLAIDDALGPPMCSIGNYPYRATKFQLQAEDTLCLFTDGVTEAANVDGFFGSERLAGALSSLAPDLPVATYACGLRDSVRSFEAGLAPADDLTVMVLRWHGKTVLLSEQAG